jgi:hypothetical protein
MRRIPLVRLPYLCLLAALASSPLAHTQTTTPPPAPTPQAQPIATLPEAPSTTVINGRLYRKPTAAEDLHAYRSELFGARPFLHAAIRSGIEQARTVPVGWGQDFPGYMQRYGSAYGEAAIDNSVRYALGAVLHEDVRYLVCHDCDFGGKLKNAALYEVTARHGADGHRAFSVTPIVSSFSGPMVAYAAWYPPGYGPSMAAKHAFLGVGTRIVFNLVREYLHDRDTPAEKAAKKSSTN